MPSVLPGIAGVLAITIVAGLIAYIGDRVGHQVGRKRLTLFGLRPKYTSTIVAVATGMLIALSVTLIALVASTQVRTAFFRLGQINARINELQAQAIAQQNELKTTRGNDLVIPIGAPIVNLALTIRPFQPDDVVLPQLASFFDQTVTQADRAWTHDPYDLKPYRLHSSDPQIQQELKRELARIRDDVVTYPADTSVLLIPIAYQNMFHGDALHFAFQHYVDRRIAAGGDVLASMDVQGGQTLNLLALQVLTGDASRQLVTRGMPPAFATNIAVNGNEAQDVLIQLQRLRGRYRIVAKASGDVYPHSGGALLDFGLVPR
ncbi:MAG TPA: DUF3084 domain-containing protein [Candidatus Baltobacteraceae bacterium]|nr:DUF3084 domain-containing protein [Candidatus Baltobacteraceae bacterium]